MSEKYTIPEPNSLDSLEGLPPKEKNTYSYSDSQIFNRPISENIKTTLELELGGEEYINKISNFSDFRNFMYALEEEDVESFKLFLINSIVFSLRKISEGDENMVSDEFGHNLIKDALTSFRFEEFKKITFMPHLLSLIAEYNEETSSYNGISVAESIYEEIIKGYKDIVDGRYPKHKTLILN